LGARGSYACNNFVADEQIICTWEVLVTIDHAELDQMQKSYKAAVEEWIAAIRHEEALASVGHDIADVDKWEAAHFKEEDLRNNVLAAKKRYEDAIRTEFFGF
jgi:hypothetical protein